MACGDENEKWKFFCFRNNSQRSSVIREWFDDLDPSERSVILAELRILLLKLQSRRREKWIRPEFAAITGNDKWRKLFEIRLKIEKKQYRFIGCFGPGDCEFTMLIPGLKSDFGFYQDACSKALPRKKIILSPQSEGRIVEFKFIGNLE